MKDLTQYKWAVSECLFNLVNGNWSIPKSIQRLKEIEEHAKANVEHKVGAELWFKLFRGDTATTDIKDIVRIATSKDESEREILVEAVNTGTSLGNEIFVYLS
jgi:lipopolysaccharide export LptBFGC system permease protein LptF